jgi:hypothetical protein
MIWALLSREGWRIKRGRSLYRLQVGRCAAPEREAN